MRLFCGDGSEFLQDYSQSYLPQEIDDKTKSHPSLTTEPTEAMFDMTWDDFLSTPDFQNEHSKNQDHTSDNIDLIASLDESTKEWGNKDDLSTLYQSTTVDHLFEDDINTPVQFNFFLPNTSFPPQTHDTLVSSFSATNDEEFDFFK